MKQILLFTGEYPPDTGGIGEYMYQLAIALHCAEYEVHVVGWQQVSSQEDIETFNQSQPYAIYPLNSKSDWRACLKYIRQVDPDLVITTDLPLTMPVWIASKLFRKPLLIIAIGSEFRQSNIAIRWLKRQIYNNTTQLVSISKFTLNLMKRLRINTSNVPIVYPGGDEKLLTNASGNYLRERYNVDGKRVLLTMGSISYRKGQDVVLKALPQILSEFPDVHYIIAGHDRVNGEMQQLAKELDITEHVTFVGKFDTAEKSAFFNLADFCLITSKNLDSGDVEGYGIVITEAALCRRTSIGTWGTGTEEAIINQRTGLLVPQDDVDAVADAAILLLKNPAYRDELAKNAYSNATENETWTQRMKDFIAIVNQIV